MVKESNRWMEISDVIPIFATLVWKLQIGSALGDALGRASISAVLADMQRDLPYSNQAKGA